MGLRQPHPIGDDGDAARAMVHVRAARREGRREIPAHGRQGGLTRFVDVLALSVERGGLKGGKRERGKGNGGVGGRGGGGVVVYMSKAM